MLNVIALLFILLGLYMAKSTVDILRSGVRTTAEFLREEKTGPAVPPKAPEVVVRVPSIFSRILKSLPRFLNLMPGNAGHTTFLIAYTDERGRRVEASAGGFVEEGRLMRGQKIRIAYDRKFPAHNIILARRDILFSAALPLVLIGVGVLYLVKDLL